MSIRWHGGKHYLAKRIIEVMPPHTRYVEPYAGGLKVLLAKPYEGISEYANDTNGELMNFWSVLRSENRFKQFAHWCNSQPLEARAFEAAKNYSPILCHDDGDAWGAFQFFVRNRMSRQGLGKDFCTPTGRTRRGMNEQVSAWLGAVEGLAELHARLIRVELWNRPAVEVIEKLDSPSTLFYLDPPYLPETRNSQGEYGLHEMTFDDHAQMLGAIVKIEGKFILSGYDSQLYRDFERAHFLNRIEFAVPNNASSSKTKEIKTEIIWTNY